MRRFWIAFACAAAIGVSAPALARQKDPRDEAARKLNPTPFASVLRAAWYTINELIIASATKMPQEHYSFRPTKDVRTFAQILSHVAADRYEACGPTIGRKPPAAGFDKLESKEQVVEVLRDSAAVCDMAYGLLSDENAGFRYPAYNGTYARAALLMSNVTHASEHYGNLVTYMRLKGIVPPSTAGVR